MTYSADVAEAYPCNAKSGHDDLVNGINMRGIKSVEGM